MEIRQIIFIVTLLIIPIQVMGQADGSIPVETPISTATPTSVPQNSAPTPAPAISVPRVTVLPTSSPIVSFSPSPIPSPFPTNNAEAKNNLALASILLGSSILIVVGYVFNKEKTKKKTNDDHNRCSNIRELLEQKKKELEEFIHSWPEEKIKALAQENISDALKKQEDAKKIIETAESLKAKHDKLKEAIELLQKKYDLCMLELPSIKKQNPTLYIMCGVGFSGKSTLAKKISEHFNIPLVSQDALYFEKKDELSIDLDSDEQWRMLLDMCKQRIKEFLKDKKSVVFDNVNLSRAHRDELRSIAEEMGAKAVVVYLDTPEEVLNKRQAENKATQERHDVKQEYLDDAKRQLEVPTNEDSYAFKPETDLESFLGELPR